MSRRKKTPSPAARARALSENERVDEALRLRRFKTFAGFLARFSALSLREMARELGVPEIIFFGYHSRWIDANTKPRPIIAGARRPRRKA